MTKLLSTNFSYNISGILFLLLILVPTCHLATFASPFVLLPSYFRQNATNSITVTPLKNDKNYNQNVDIDIRISGTRNNKNVDIFRQKLKAKRAGAPHSITFPLNIMVDEATIKINVQNHEQFECKMNVRPDLATFHLHTDKNIYRAGDIVNVRALPLTHNGSIYRNLIEFVLVNPDNFELVRKVHQAEDNFISTKFELPAHLFYGEWRIVARPVEIRDVSMTYDTQFTVSNYELPPFKILAVLTPGQPLESTEITVDARYFHGAPISGTLSVVCHPTSKNQTSQSHQLLQTQIVDGLLKQKLDIRQCFSIDHRLPAKFVIDIRDKGTGNRGETKLDFDPLASLFEIIPLRPLFSEKTPELLFVIHSTGASPSTQLEITFTCLSVQRFPPTTKTTKLSSVVVFTIPDGWDQCKVIMVQASALLNGNTNSRAKTLMIPRLSDVSSIEPSYINLQNPQSIYSVGSKLEARVAKRTASKLNYIVLCNSIDVVTVGKIRDDGTLSLLVTSRMLGKCVLFVYTTQGQQKTDMIQFYVGDDCQASTFASQSEVRPGQNVTFTLNGEAYGLAVLRALDDRLNQLATKNEPIKTKSWDFSMFHRPEHRSNHARLINFIDVKQIEEAIKKTCYVAGKEYHTMLHACPEAKITPSCVSNACLKTMIDTCNNPDTPNQSPSCEGGSCERGFKLNMASIQLIRQRPAPAPASAMARGMLSDPSLPISDEPEMEDDNHVREYFHEVWLFDSFPLGASGTASVSRPSPDSIGRWSISSAFWSPGQKNLCRPKNLEIVAKKDFFMEVDIPRNVYINETITVKISVSSLTVEKETKLAICMTDLSRKVCADQGSFGRQGEPTYTRVVISKDSPIDTKTFTMRFLVTGPTNVVFNLREEASYPGKHHCDVGKILDSVKLSINIAKRADTEEHYKRLILNADRPLANVMLNDAPLEVVLPAKDVIEVTEFRSPSDSNAMITQIQTNILDTDTVFSFTVDISRFLPFKPVPEVSNRVKRGVLDYGNMFMSDVIKKLSVELYQFKRVRMQQHVDARQLESQENKIGSLISDMLRFSDCTNDTACGYAEYGRPSNSQERSPLLTAVATSLLCEASADERLVCGSMKYIHDNIINGRRDNIDLHDMIDLTEPVDKMWFLNSMLLHVRDDCAAYSCVDHEEAWRNLYLSYYNLDESWNFDDRTIAALAYMGTNATMEIMRIKMRETLNKDMLPFWSAGVATLKSKGKSSSFEEIYRLKRMKSGDVLVNALGVLAFVVAGAEGASLDWDPLANWLYEQQADDNTFDGPLDSYFASRALYEYRFRKVELQNDGNLQVAVSCPTCEIRIVNVTEAAQEIYLPTHVRNLTLTTSGHGKIKAGIRILATKRQRSRRGLTQDDYYPVRITVDQMTIATGTIKQIVCLKVFSPILKQIEVTHGLFTGYSSTPTSISVLQNSTELTIVDTPAISSFAAHFIVTGLEQHLPLCYEIGVTEPDHRHEPLHLAPVAIQARHPVTGVVGLVLISHPDQLMRKRRSTSTSWLVSKRSRRGIIDESIDTVCFEGGMCSCAETSCSVQCNRCQLDTVDELRRQLDEEENTFALFVNVRKVERVLKGNVFYESLECDVRYKKGRSRSAISDKLTIWVRQCNERCLPSDSIKDEDYFLIGDVDGLAVDSEGHQQYVVRDSDRLELATTDCTVLTNVIVLRSPSSRV